MLSRTRKIMNLLNNEDKENNININNQENALNEALLHDVILENCNSEPEVDLCFLNSKICDLERCDSEFETETKNTSIFKNVNYFDLGPDYNLDEHYLENCDTEFETETDVSKKRNTEHSYLDLNDLQCLKNNTEEIKTNNTSKDTKNTVEITNKQKRNIVDYSDSDDSEVFRVTRKSNECMNTSNDTSSSKFLNNSDEFDSSSDCDNFKGKRIKKAQSQLKKNKIQRLAGKSYVNYKGQIQEKKTLLPNPCYGKRCFNECNNFTEEERKNLFENFWKLQSNTDKRSFINGCVNITSVKRKRTLAENSRRGLTYLYFFMKSNKQVKVCLQFFLKTLNITEKFLRNSIQGKIDENKDKRGKHEPKHKITPNQMNEFKNFIKSLPAVPSHYCRSSTSKLYLPAEVKNISNLYRIYKSTMENQNSDPIGMSCFKKFLKRDYNIGIHVPKKDKCIKCERYKNIPDSEKTDQDKEDYNNHQISKDAAKLLFLKEQNRSTTDGFLVTSFDLQKVLATPHGPSMMFGFSRKYAVYNFTVYESKSQNSYCYLWGEKDGKRGVNEICTNLYSYLHDLDQMGNYQSVSLFCDNCPGQNKNRFVLSMLCFFIKNSRSITNISLTYLVAGHTYMPVDSVHAVIEKYTAKINIQAPSEWPTILRNARRRPKPYEVINVHFKDFLDWKVLAVPKKLKGSDGIEIKINDIKIAKFSKSDSNKIWISTSYDTDCVFHDIEWPMRKIVQVPQSYASELPINKKKLKDLLDLCKNLSINREYHGEYFALSSGKNVPDTLAESDVDDCDF